MRDSLILRSNIPMEEFDAIGGKGKPRSHARIILGSMQPGDVIQLATDGLLTTKQVATAIASSTRYSTSRRWSYRRIADGESVMVACLAKAKEKEKDANI